MRNYIVSYSPPDIVRVIKGKHLRWAGNIARMKKVRNAFFLILKGKPTGNRPLGKPRRR